MSGISSATLSKTKQAILTCCDSIIDFRELIQIFNDQRINPWKNKIPHSSVALTQTELLIGALYEQNRSDTGENALALFLTVLAERHDEKTKCYDLLLGLASEISHELNQPRESLPEKISKEFIKDRLEAFKDKRNYIDSIFLKNALSVSRSVCRLEWHKRGVGTGVLLAEDLILTNYHVINADQSANIKTRLEQFEIRFGAVKMEDGGVSAGNLVIKLNSTNPLVLHSDINDLDFAILRLCTPIKENQDIETAKFSIEPICIGQSANIVHYPLGGPMQYSLRHNEILAVDNKRFYYLSDTEEGSSGSPVFSDNWNVIGIHRAGGLLDEKTGDKVLEGNQGIPFTILYEKIQKYVTI